MKCVEPNWASGRRTFQEKSEGRGIARKRLAGIPLAARIKTTQSRSVFWSPLGWLARFFACGKPAKVRRWVQYE